jgi:uncharacterized membrane protein YdbT with pleckstrin-like domain
MAHCTWPYLVSAVSALRGAPFYRLNVGGWEIWIIGDGLLLTCAATLRRGAHYELTSKQLVVRNGFTGHEIQSIPLSDVSDVVVRQGIVAGFFGIGTVFVRVRSTDRLLSLGGVNDPDAVKIRIETPASKLHGPTRQAPANS